MMVADAGTLMERKREKSLWTLYMSEDVRKLSKASGVALCVGCEITAVELPDLASVGTHAIIESHMARSSS